MLEHATKWEPIADIDSPFGSIAYAFRHDSLSVQMIGVRTLTLAFTGVVALRFEQECPGFDFIPLPLPRLTPAWTFPLLLVDGSPWRERYGTTCGELLHFALVSNDHLLQLLASSLLKYSGGVAG